MKSPLGSKKREKFLTYTIDGKETTRNIGGWAEYFCISKPNLHQIIAKFGGVQEALPELLANRDFKINGAPCAFSGCKGTGRVPPGSSRARKYCCTECTRKAQIASATKSVGRQIAAKKKSSPWLTCTICGKKYQNIYTARKAPTCQDKSCLAAWKRAQVETGLGKKKVKDNREEICAKCLDNIPCTDRAVFDGIPMPEDKTKCLRLEPEKDYRAEALGNQWSGVGQV